MRQRLWVCPHEKGYELRFKPFAFVTLTTTHWEKDFFIFIYLFFFQSTSEHVVTEAKLSHHREVIHLTNAMTVKGQSPQCHSLCESHYGLFLIIYLSCATADLVTQNWHYGVCLTPCVTQLAWLSMIQKGSHLLDRGTDCHSILCHIVCFVCGCVSLWCLVNFTSLCLH